MDSAGGAEVGGLPAVEVGDVDDGTLEFAFGR
jgi:hypothetical protein